MNQSKRSLKIKDGIWEESGIWRYRFMHKGKRHFAANPLWKNRGEAKAARDKHRTAVREGRADSGTANTNFRVFVEESFLPYVETSLAPLTCDAYTHRAAKLVEVFGHLDLDKISTFAVEKFKSEQKKRITKRGSVQAPGSVNGYLLALGSILTCAVDLGLISAEDRPKITLLANENKRTRYLSIDEERALLEAASPWPYLQDVIVVGLATGLRRTELLGLRRENIDFALNVLSVVGKGGKLRSVPINPASAAYAVLSRRCREQADWLFTAPRSDGNLRWLDRSLASACATAKLEDVTLHTLRHTFGTRLVAAGVDLKTVQDLMGHGSVQTTMIYIHVVAENKYAAILKLEAYSADCHNIATDNVVEFNRKAG